MPPVGSFLFGVVAAFAVNKSLQHMVICPASVVSAMMLHTNILIDNVVLNTRYVCSSDAAVVKSKFVQPWAHFPSMVQPWIPLGSKEHCGNALFGFSPMPMLVLYDTQNILL